MKKVFFVMLFLVSAIYSQEKRFELNLGVNSAWFNFEEEMPSIIKTEFKANMNFAVLYQVYKKNKLSVSTGIGYLMLERYSYDSRDFGDNVKYYENIDHSLISIPLQVKYNVGISNFNSIFNIEPSYIIKSNYEGVGYNDGKIESREFSDEMNRFQLFLGLGFEYKFLLSSEMFSIKTIFNYGITKFPKDESYKVDEQTTRKWLKYSIYSVNLFLGYHF